jgi:NodT family efflux transporter outer membrane factor (OMF) lipoprotein
MPQRMRAANLALTSAVTLLLAGCLVGPKYVKPVVPVTPSFKEAPPAYKEDAGWHPANPADSLPKGEWWQVFNDAGLNALEPQIQTSNQNVRIADANLQSARAQIRINRADLFPTLGASPSTSFNRSSSNRPYFNPPASNNGFGDILLPLQINWEIDLFGRIRHNINAAREDSQAYAADFQNVLLSLQAELATDYFELRAADAQKKLLNDTVAQYQEALRVTTNRFEGGVAVKSDLYQAQTQLQAAKVAASDIDAFRAQYEHAIAILIGEPPAALTLPIAPLNAQPPAVPPGLPSELLERRPDIAAAERRTAAANEQIGIARAAYFPRLTLSALGGFEGSSALNVLNGSSYTYGLGPTLGQTIFEAGRRRGVSEQAQAGFNSATASYRLTTLIAYSQVEDSLSNLRILADEAEQQRQATVAAQSAEQIFNNRYVGGIDTYLQVITAQTTALVNERNDIDIMRRRMDASVLLIKALGGGWNISQLPKS